jgi:opacity protein-like surface antigen
MAKLMVSIALAIAVGQLAATSGAQTPPARQDAPKAVPTTEATPPAADAPSPASPTYSTAAIPSASPAIPPLSYPTTSPETGTNAAEDQTDPLQQSVIPVVVNQPSPPDVEGAPRTYEYRFTATLDLANVLWRSGQGYDLFSTNDAAWRIAVGIGYDVLKLPNQWIVAVEAGYLAEPDHGSAQGLLGGSLSGTVSASTLLLGGSLRWSMTPWIAPYGRLGLLASRIAMDIHANSTDPTSPASGASWSHHKWAEGGTLGAGVMLNLLPRMRVNAGLLVEGGLWLQRAVDIRLDSNLPTGALSTSGARIGALENTGPYFRLAGMLRF